MTLALTNAKEAAVHEALQKVAENHRRAQTLVLAGSAVLQAKPTLLFDLADGLRSNTRLTALNLRSCGIGDEGLKSLAVTLRDNVTLFELDLAYNKLGRPGLTALAQSLRTNMGLHTLDLTGCRIDCEVCVAFADTFKSNVTLYKLIWNLSNAPGGYALRFTEVLNRNAEVERCVRECREYTSVLPIEMQQSPPLLEARVVPDLSEEEFGMEIGMEIGSMLWCKMNGRWELTRLVGTRARKLLVQLEVSQGTRAEELEQVDEAELCEVEPRDVTCFEPSHAQDLPNMQLMHNLHEAPLLYLLQVLCLPLLPSAALARMLQEML